MKLERVTITGADNSTDILELMQLSYEFPFVEWGILISKSQQGGPRFPSRSWIAVFSDMARSHKLNVATHMCGRWVRDLLIGEVDWDVLPTCIAASQRVQINISKDAIVCAGALSKRLLELKNKRFIFQSDGVNDNLANAMHICDVPVAALFDTSGGTGLLPGNWPTLRTQFPFGFAGGLGPDNVLAQLDQINLVCSDDFPTWIDMETRVRVEDNSALDMVKVQSVLQSVKDSGWLRSQ
ncbi:MAG: hypothetical protein RB191_05525 [Terriglobia bacterium]|nr:hypothetical protein [Terriglobia bacterium]